MGSSLKKLAKIAFLPVTATVATVNAASKAAGIVNGNKSSSSSAKQAMTMAAASLAKEKEDNSKKRVRLYATENGELGEEVDSVGESAKRGRIFGNQ